MAQTSNSIRYVENESYVTEYSLATNGFFQPEIWSILDADCRAYILDATINNESHYYDISPRYYVDAEDLGFSFETEDIQMDDVFLLKCGGAAFEWRADESDSGIIIDKELLSNLDVQEALFVCHKAFYYAYARHMVNLLDQDKLPKRYKGCIKQLEQYKEDLLNCDKGSSYTDTALEKDAISFGISRAHSYYSYVFPKEAEVSWGHLQRIYWRDCLSGVYKKVYLQRLVNELSTFYHAENDYQIVSSEDEMHRREVRDKSTLIVMDEALLESGEALDCISVLIQSIFPASAEYCSKLGKELDQNQWSLMATESAWNRLVSIMQGS